MMVSIIKKIPFDKGGEPVKKAEKPKRRFWAGVGGALLLTLLGIVLVIQVITQYGQIFMKNQDDYLLHLAQSVDKNISNLLDRYEYSMNYVTSRRDFREAQERLRQDGDSARMLELLEESLLNQEELIAAVLVAEGGEVILSTDGKREYSFLPGSGLEILRPCVGGDGAVYLALTHEEEGLLYAALLDLDLFYDQLVSRAFTDHNWVLLTDARCQVLLYQQQRHAYVDRVDAVTSATSGQEGVTLLLDSQKERRVRTVSYQYYDADANESYTARMAAVPSTESENGSFAVAVVANFEKEAAALNYTIFRLVLSGGMVMAGIALLVGLMIRARHKDERELLLLRRKNEQMEELNRQTQELAHHQRLETIGTLTSSIAHEFNNLLTPIMGYSILVLEQLPPEDTELYDNMLEIYNASQKAKTIISRLSDLSRKNANLTYQYLSPDELAGRVLEVSGPARPAKVEVRLEAGCPQRWLFGNETQLFQLLLNLILNSFYAMSEEGGTLTLTTAAEGERVLFRVADTGCGIPPEILPRIFDPFFTTKESGKGTGLGLAIVRQVAEEHQGEITVDSQVGKGTSITVFFPLRRREEEAE